VIAAPLASVPKWLGWTTSAPTLEGGVLRLLGARYALIHVNDQIWATLTSSMGVMLILLLLRVLLRKHWIAVVGVLTLFSVIGLFENIAAPKQTLLLLPVSWLIIGSIFFLISRFGLLSVWAYLLCLNLVLAANGAVTAWYGKNLLVFYFAIVTLTTYACWISLAGRPLFSEGLVPEE
jgi:hypothetical protein